MKQVLAYPSWEQLQLGCAALASQASAHAPFEAIIGLSRGGLVPGVIMSHMMNIPLISVDYSSTAGKGDNRDKTNVLPDLPEDVGHVLVVDDISDSGLTLCEVFDYYMRRVGDRISMDSATLYYKEGSSHVPDFVWQTIPKDAPWIIFPWEM